MNTPLERPPAEPEHIAFKRSRGPSHMAGATRYAMSGLTLALRHESAFRQELLACVLLVPLALWMDVTGAERALLIASLFGVLIVELLNSAIEATVDRISTERHELSRRAKDYGAAAVCLALVGAAGTWMLIAGPVALRALQDAG